MSDIQDIKIRDEQEPEIEDEAAQDETVIPEQYDITSYGADYDVEGLVRRIKRGEIFIPTFQRNYVWNLYEASRFIESLLLGLPVPGVFLARETETNKLLVIDGQQRLKTLQFYYDGAFNPRSDSKIHRIFALEHVQERLEGKTYESLDEKDRLRLDNAIVHATIIKQESPSDDDTSIYYIFERLNSYGRKLNDQEIRTALYHGNLINLIGRINQNQTWRTIFGPINSRLKDQEFILRFIALFFSGESYTKPMKEFLNKFLKLNRNPNTQRLGQYEQLFEKTISIAFNSLGKTAFRISNAINAAIFDSVMVGLARRGQEEPTLSSEAVQSAYLNLLDDKAYLLAVTRATSDEGSVSQRLDLATKYFSSKK